MSIKGSVSWGWERVQNKPHMLGGFRQTRLGQLAAKKHRTVSAGLVRQYGMRLEKARKYLPAVVCLPAVPTSTRLRGCGAR